MPANKVAPIPKRQDLQHAGAIATTGLTALQGIDGALALQKGETVIIHGASGGVGTLAVQFARWRGARVFATASGVDGLELVQEMGAHAVVDGKRVVDIDDRARAFAPQGVDAVLALAGGDALEQCLAALRAGGRVAHPNGIEPAPRKRRSMTLTRLPECASSSASTRRCRRQNLRFRSRSVILSPRLTRRTNTSRKAMSWERSCYLFTPPDCEGAPAP